MKIIFTYLLTLPILMLLDFLFLGVIAKEYYFRLMSPIVTIEFNYIFAIIFYALYLLGLFIFVIFPNLQNPNTLNVIILGALFGFFCYMTYDFTNMATIKNWPLKLIFIDMLWGAFVTGFISFIAIKIYQLF